MTDHVAGPSTPATSPRSEPPALCENRWKYGRDTCALDHGHIGPHRNTKKQDAWSFSWFDSEGTPNTVPSARPLVTALDAERGEGQ